jgi:O-antigen biosynthesis protein WbqV
MAGPTRRGRLWAGRPSPAGWLTGAGWLAGLLPSLLLLRERHRLRRLRFAQRSEADLLAPYLDHQQLSVRLEERDHAYLRDAVVLVIGAGGTIARELVGQLDAARPRLVVLVDNNENGLYALVRWLGLHRPGLVDRVRPELANIRDRERTEALFAQYRPDVVFHYANYKSASLGNSSPYGFVLVNVGGTRNVLTAVDRTPSVRRVVYISSDKAESASQTYGRTKRVAELLVQAHAQRNPAVRYVCVRYCNVLDAAGSFAIPTFRQQILTGAPVTVRTFPGGVVPDRYFITIAAAARLAIVGGALAGRGNVLSLDSHRVAALRIDDLVRILARAYGVRDVEGWFGRRVRFVAADPGEKRSEELGTGTPVQGVPLVEVATAAPIDADGLDAAVTELLERTRRMELDGLAGQLAEIVAAYGGLLPAPSRNGHRPQPPLAALGAATGVVLG